MEALFDFSGFHVLVRGRAVDWFTKDYGWFRIEPVDAIDANNMALIVEDQDLPRYKFHDPEFSCLPDSIHVDRHEPVIRYGISASPALLLRLVESLLHWPDRCLVHAASMSLSGRGILVAGPDDTGKTNTVIRFMEAGYSFLSDDWSLVGKDGLLHPFPRSIHLFDYNLLANPRIIDSVTRFPQSVMAVIRLRANLRFRLMSGLPSLARKAYERFLPAPMWAVEPEQLGGRIGNLIPLTDLVWMQRWYGDDFEVDQVSTDEIIRQIIGHYNYERSHWLRLYHRLASFGFTTWMNHLANANGHYRQVLSSAFKQFETVASLRIPEHASPKEVADHVVGLIGSR